MDDLSAQLDAAATRTAEKYCWVFPEGYKVTHHPYAAKNRRVKGVYPGGKVWSDSTDTVLRHLWVSLIGVDPK